MKNKHTNFKAFTLIELLIVIGIIAILAAAVIVAINPGRQFQQARDATRSRNLNTLNQAILSYQVSHQGGWGDLSIPEEPTEICDTGSDPDPDPGEVEECVDLSPLVPGFINQIPKDPSL